MNPQRPIKRLLVANRGEIAVRILHATRELCPSVETYALYTPDDHSHCDLGHPQHALQIPSAAAYLDIPLLTQLAREHGIDTVHPGYGFLSESAEFAQRMHEVGVHVIGPGSEVLARTGDKLQAKQLAEECGVPVLRAMTQATDNLDEIRAFAQRVGYPVMIKAVDGGGGRGIRLVRQVEELQNAVQRATGESPSKTVFVEKAAVDGFHHIEVQVVGDGSGRVCHLWERDCSVQRRFQKIVECAPSLIGNRALVARVIDAALRIARAIRYLSLGTFEFLVSESRGEFYFLEINPRLQVEHTVTEVISGIDLVQTQLLLAQGYSLDQIGLHEKPANAPPAGTTHSIQLRVCAEDPRSNFSLSIGKVTEFVVPSGHGIRLDTHVDVSGATPLIVGANFDNLLAKIIVSAGSWEATVRKARRVLADSRISGVKTNLDLLRRIVAHDEFMSGQADTQWLENKNMGLIVQYGETLTGSAKKIGPATTQSSLSSIPASSSLLFRRGDAWSITLEPLQGADKQKLSHHLQLSRVLQNDFPSSLTAEIEYTTPGSQSAVPYRLQLAATSTSAAALTSSHRRGDPRNPLHIVLPLSGKLIEVLVNAGEAVAENQVVAFVKQMKMELEVRSPRAGRAKWVYEMEDDEEDVAEGMLMVELESQESQSAKVEVRGKL